MEEKLVTLAILTYTKAQILKNVLENEGIETYIHNVNQIQPVVSSGVRLRIKESDLPRALKITESSAWLAESIVGEKTPKVEHRTKKVLIPVDFSNYSMKACEFGFNFAKSFDAEVILLHVYFTPIYASSLPYGDVFNYQISDEETVKNVLHKVHDDLNTLSEKIKQKAASGEFPDVKYTCVLREGIPEEEILRYNKEHRPRIIIMGTRGKNQKDVGVWEMCLEPDSLSSALACTFHFGKPAKENTAGTLQIKTNPLAFRQKNTTIVKDEFFLSEYVHVSTVEMGT